ncbi:MAG: hypothetical protein WD995_00185 [Gemmatimonadota bacterium]
MVHSFLKEDVMFKKLSLPGLLLFAALAFFSAPTQPLAASDCGENSGEICSETTTCKSWWIFRWGCSVTSWSYWAGL